MNWGQVAIYLFGVAIGWWVGARRRRPAERSGVTGREIGIDIHINQRLARRITLLTRYDHDADHHELGILDEAGYTDLDDYGTITCPLTVVGRDGWPVDVDWDHD